jgi:hypothetical protein
MRWLKKTYDMRLLEEMDSRNDPHDVHYKDARTGKELFVHLLDATYEERK